jgi:hypothetical protein
MISIYSFVRLFLICIGEVSYVWNIVLVYDWFLVWGWCYNTEATLLLHTHTIKIVHCQWYPQIEKSIHSMKTEFFINSVQDFSNTWRIGLFLSFCMCVMDWICPSVRVMCHRSFPCHSFIYTVYIYMSEYRIKYSDLS